MRGVNDSRCHSPATVPIAISMTPLSSICMAAAPSGDTDWALRFVYDVPSAQPTQANCSARTP